VTGSDPNRPKDSGVGRKQLLMKATQRLLLVIADALAVPESVARLANSLTGRPQPQAVCSEG
jgi:hypothetical protein